MPDRFSNGDPSNDNIEGMLEKAKRANPDGRHGGDLQGIFNHLDYFNKLGVTAIWINPILENNMPNYSYHGYAITDFYKVDSRFGSNNDYAKLITTAHTQNLKIIMDMVLNHCGSNHWWINDLPSKDWIHQFDEFTQSNYRAEVLMDPYASANDKKLMSDGWFDRSMPDLNQKNPFLANYLIQNSIWWIEYAQLDGIRMDTYPYSDQDFMHQWEQRVYEEYPNFKILGEAWLQYEGQTAWFQNQANAQRNAIYHSLMITDFPLAYAINSAFNESDGWTSGLSKLYYTLSKDFLYKQPKDLVIFTDNHDIDRFYSTQHKDFAKWKMGMTFLMTTRGIPMLYYGTEYLAEGLKHEGDAQLRKDFLGGWQNDSINAFTKQGFNSTQVEAFNYLQKLIKLKKDNPCLQSGKLTHFIPKDGVYTYFRTENKCAFIIVLNNTDKQKQITLNPYNEILKNYNSIKAIDQDTFDKIPQQLYIEAKSAQIFELK
jgi:glycosidase